MRPQRSSITEFPRRSSDHGINSAQADQSDFSLRLNAFGSDVFAWHGRCPAEAIGAISRSVARGYARGTSSISTKSLPAVRSWDVNRRAIRANISCTAHGTRSFGQAGAYNSRRKRFAVPADFSKVSHCRTAIKMTLPNIVARMQPTGRANARPMINSAKSGNERDACPGFRFAASGLQPLTARPAQVICPLSSLISDFPKNILVPTHPKSHLQLSHPTPPEGRIMIVTDAGRDAVDAAVLGVRCERRADCSP